MTEELARLEAGFQDALDFIQSLYEMELANKSLEEADIDTKGQVLRDLQKIDVYAQLVYCGNLQREDGASALLGLQTGIRAAFILGYLLAKLKYQIHSLTPLIAPLKGNIQ